jgi:hypothetical protein
MQFTVPCIVSAIPLFLVAGALAAEVSPPCHGIARLRTHAFFPVHCHCFRAWCMGLSLFQSVVALVPVELTKRAHLESC